MNYCISLARNKLKFVCLKLRLTHVFDFKWRRGQPCQWLSGTNNWVRAHVGDVIIVWRNTHTNMEPNAIWFPATLTATDLNIQGSQVKYCTNGNCNMPVTESRLWGTKWYYLFSAQVRMLRRGSSKGYPAIWYWWCNALGLISGYCPVVRMGEVGMENPLIWDILFTFPDNIWAIDMMLQFTPCGHFTNIG